MPPEAADGHVGAAPDGIAPPLTAAEALPPPEAFKADETPDPFADPREASAQAIREALTDGAPESTEPEPGAEGEPVPAAEPEPEPEPSAPRYKPSIVQEAHRKNQAAKRENLEAKEARDETRAMLAEMKALQTERESYDQAFKADPIGSTMKRTGMSREQVIAANADGQAGDIPPAIATMLEEQRAEIQALKDARSTEKSAKDEAEVKANNERLIGSDLDQIDAGLTEGGVDQYPAALSLPAEDRRALSRSILMSAVAEMQALGDHDKYGPADLLDALELASRKRLDPYHENPYIRSRLASAQAEGAPAQGTRPPRRPAGLSARQAAAPAAKETTEQNTRELAAAAIRQSLRESR